MFEQKKNIHLMEMALSPSSMESWVEVSEGDDPAENSSPTSMGSWVFDGYSEGSPTQSVVPGQGHVGNRHEEDLPFFPEGSPSQSVVPGEGHIGNQPEAEHQDCAIVRSRKLMLKIQVQKSSNVNKTSRNLSYGAEIEWPTDSNLRQELRMICESDDVDLGEFLRQQSMNWAGSGGLEQLIPRAHEVFESDPAKFTSVVFGGMETTAQSKRQQPSLPQHWKAKFYPGHPNKEKLAVCCLVLMHSTDCAASSPQTGNERMVRLAVDDDKLYFIRHGPGTRLGKNVMQANRQSFKVILGSDSSLTFLESKGAKIIALDYMVRFRT